MRRNKIGKDIKYMSNKIKRARRRRRFRGGR